MHCEITSAPLAGIDADWLIVGIPESAECPPAVADLDNLLGGQLTRLREAQDVTGKLGELLVIADVPALRAQRLLLVGLGLAADFNDVKWNRAVLIAARHCSTKPERRIALVVPGGADQTALIRAGAAALHVGCVGQDLYRTERQRFPFCSLQLAVPNGSDLAAAQQAADEGEILGTAVNLTRDLVNQPPDVIFPASFADRAQKVADECGLSCQILDEAAMRAEKMLSLLGVAQGSTQPPRLVVLEYRGAAPEAPTLALVGKGVTFDSGGLSLKTNEGMLTMKCDMAGAATVLGAISAIARLKLPVNVTAYMGLVENMPSGSAFKLGDILHARNGVTIEVLNTDAEGRLVLADVLSYSVDRGDAYLVDLATLTGACVVALGEEVVGAFTNAQPWCDQLLAASRRCGEDTWQLPMFDHYNELIKGDVGDIKNTGGRWGGAITAAKFLERFVAGRPWVHLDIAGPAFAASPKPHREGGATGVMVRTLVDLARNFPPAA